MSRLIGLLLPLLGYLAAGTVVSAGVGYAYLRHSGQLSDETLFRMLALLHGVELQEPAAESDRPADAHSDDLPEEASFDEQQQITQIASLQFDAKRKQIADALTDFEYQLKRLDAATNQYDILRRDVELYLERQSKLVADASLQQVKAQLEVLSANKQAKPLLIKMIEDGRIDQVITLLASINKRKQLEILQSFNQQPDDIDMLYQIWEKMLADNPLKQQIDERIKSLNELNQQDN